MFKKLKEKIDFIKFAYATRKAPNNTVNALITVNNIKPILVQAERIVDSGELQQYERFIKRDLLEQFLHYLDNLLVMEKEDLFNGTFKVIIRCYISPFKVADNNGFDPLYGEDSEHFRGV